MTRPTELYGETFTRFIYDVGEVSVCVRYGSNWRISGILLVAGIARFYSRN